MRSFITLVRVLAFVALIGVVLLSHQAFADDAAEKRALAVQVNEARPVKAQLERVMDARLARFPADKRTAAKEKIMAAIDYEKIDAVTIDGLVSVYTLDELKAMADFYGSDTGKSIEKKAPALQALVKPEVQKVLDAALMKIQLSGPLDEGGKTAE